MTYLITALTALSLAFAPAAKSATIAHIPAGDHAGGIAPLSLTVIAPPADSSFASRPGSSFDSFHSLTGLSQAPSLRDIPSPTASALPLSLSEATLQPQAPLFTEVSPSGHAPRALTPSAAADTSPRTTASRLETVGDRLGQVTSDSERKQVLDASFTGSVEASDVSSEAPDASVEAVSDASLAAVTREVYKLRDRVWAGKIAPDQFYPQIVAAFKARFGPQYDPEIRKFLEDKAAARRSAPSAIDFSAMSAEERKDFFNAMPKGAELHVHLSGAMAPKTWLKIAEMLNTEFPVKIMADLISRNGEDPQALGLDPAQEKMSIHAMSPALKAALGRTFVTGKDEKGMTAFLERWQLIALLVRPEAYPTMFTALAEASSRKNIPYLEVMLESLDPLLSKATTMLPSLEATTGVTIRLIANNAWHQSPETVAAGMQTAKKYLDQGVVGYNMVADERTFRPLRHYEAFQVMRKTIPGLQATLHAGEQTGTADNMVNDLLLNVRRYGHATQVEEDAIAMALLYTRKTPVEVSLFSNQKTGAMEDLSKHPLAKMLAWGVPVSLSTDDPGVFQTTLAQEYEVAQRTFGLSWQDLKGIARNGILCAFCDSKTKRRLLRDLDTRIAKFEKKWIRGR